MITMAHTDHCSITWPTFTEELRNSLMILNNFKYSCSKV